MSKPTVFLSYHHSESAFADFVEEQIADVAVVVRDKNAIAWNGSIRKHENAISEQDFALLLINDAFLCSDACMYEVVRLWSNEGADRFWERVIPFVDPEDRPSVFDPVKSMEYVLFWEKRCATLNDRLNDLDNVAGSAHRRNLRNAREIRDSISDFLLEVGDHLEPDQWHLVEHLRDSFKKF